MIKLSQKIQLRAAVGWSAGLAVGMTGAFVVLMFFTPMNPALRIFMGIGLFCAIGATTFQLITSIEMLKNYNAALKMFEKKKVQEKAERIEDDKVRTNQKEVLTLREKLEKEGK